MRKILLVEDEDDQREILKDIFKQEYQVLEAHNGHIGLEVAIKESPHMILLDVRMPIMDGFEMLRAFKKLKERDMTPIMVLTNMSLDKAQRSFIARTPATHYRLKTNVTIFELQDIVRELIQVNVLNNHQ